MNLLQLHKRLAVQAMNPSDELGEEKAKSVRWIENGKPVSLYEKIITQNKLRKEKIDSIEMFDKDGNLKQKIK